MAIRVISLDIRKGKLPQGYELKTSDIGTTLDVRDGFGPVLPVDVGKRCWVRSYGFCMENCEQRDKRLNA